MSFLETPFGALLTRLRHASNLTQEDLASHVGLDARAILDLERGTNRVPRKETIKLLADALDLSGEAREEFEATAEKPRAMRTGLTAGGAASGGHAFMSYVREDAADVDALQQLLEVVGVRVWRDTADLWPGDDWRSRVRQAITDNALAFIACFSSQGVSRSTSYQNAELLLATEQLRLRPPKVPWLIPVRFDACEIPDWDLGGGRTLTSLQRADVFGPAKEQNAARLVTAVARILEGHQDSDLSPGLTNRQSGTVHLPNW